MPNVTVETSAHGTPRATPRRPARSSRRSVETSATPATVTSAPDQGDGARPLAQEDHREQHADHRVGGADRRDHRDGPQLEGPVVRLVRGGGADPVQDDEPDERSQDRQVRVRSRRTRRSSRSRRASGRGSPSRGCRYACPRSPLRSRRGRSRGPRRARRSRGGPGFRQRVDGDGPALRHQERVGLERQQPAPEVVRCARDRRRRRGPRPADRAGHPPARIARPASARTPGPARESGAPRRTPPRRLPRAPRPAAS